MLLEIWSLIGSYASPAEQPIWAQATSNFEKEFQFNQKWLEMMPQLLVLAAAEGNMDRVKEVKKSTDETTNRAVLAAAKGGHIEVLEWLKENNWHQKIDERRVWISGVSHARVREWVINRRLPYPFYSEEEYHSAHDKKETYKRYANDVQMWFLGIRAIVAEEGNLEVIKLLHAEETYKEIKIKRAFALFGVNYQLQANGSVHVSCRQILLYLVEHGHIAALVWCLDKWPNLGAQVGMRAIKIATQENKIEIVQELIKRGYQAPASICARLAVHYGHKLLQLYDSRGYALHVSTYSTAARMCGPETLEWLEERKCPINILDALYEAVEYSNYPVVRFLIDRHNAISETIPLSGRTVHTACSHAYKTGNLDMIRVLHECKVPWTGEEMNTAATNNRIDAMALLRELGAPIKADTGYSALHNNNYKAYAWLRSIGWVPDKEENRIISKLPPFLRESITAAAMAATNTAASKSASQSLQ